MVLERRVLPMTLINLIKSKLEGATAKVKYNGKLSEEFNLSHGLTQGGILREVKRRAWKWVRL